MTRLTVALLVFSVFTPTIFAQCVETMSFEQAQHRVRKFSGWFEMVKDAEMDYKHKKGRYGDLAALRKAHLLRSLVFESGSSAAPKGRSQDNFVSEDTRFQVTVSADGQHFRVAISDMWVAVFGADETGFGATAQPLLCPVNEMRE
jgi:hypothetical protein